MPQKVLHDCEKLVRMFHAKQIFATNGVNRLLQITGDGNALNAPECQKFKPIHPVES